MAGELIYRGMSVTDRLAFLCGTDAFSGRSYEHRRLQIQNDVLRLASIFFIDVAAFAVMSNHYHLCLLYTSPSPRDKRQSRMPSSA